MEVVVIILYALPIFFVFLYSLIQLHLVFLYEQKRRKDKKEEKTIPILDEYPIVTVQLPIYNELYVVDRLIDQIVTLDYPSKKLEIQVLDDSTDETVNLIAKKVAYYQEQGIDIQHVRRPERKGFKAGALAYGTDVAKGEFLAVFDADFLPSPDFLKKTIPYFQDSNIGAVQTRWEHLNENYSLITQLQAFGLNAHFRVEQTGRNFGNHFINFNGTAGIWRKDCIETAGGWSADTLTEDLDLSYRAQLKGWKFKYLEEVGTPAELPVTLNALKSQQFRWTKGAAENTRKNLGKVWRHPNIPFVTRLHALFHLMNSSVFICILMIAILSVPVIWVKANFTEYHLVFQYGQIFILSMIFLASFYFASYCQEVPYCWRRFFFFIGKFVLFLAMTMGLALHNSIAVWEGYWNKKTAFIRTPKFNITQKKGSWKSNKYLKTKINGLTIFEMILSIYFFVGVILDIYWQSYSTIFFHGMLALGFGYVAFYTFIHSQMVKS